MKNKMNEQVKFARWVLIHTDEAKHTAGVCRYYQSKLYTIDEIFDIYTNIQSKSEKAELTPHIKYHPNGNVQVKGQKNSVGQREGIWEYFYTNGNIHWRTPYKEGKEDGIQEFFYKYGNIQRRTPYKRGKIDGIEQWFDEQGYIIETYLWKDGELIEETKH
jgi:antitoxin component YwqK of YwqJK toxin-antitoxin module